MTYKLRPHPWLPEQTTYGDRPSCDNCKKFGESCGRVGWICGDWEEAEQIQMKIGE